MNESTKVITSMQEILNLMEDGYILEYSYRPGWAYLFDPSVDENGIEIRYDVAERFVSKYKDILIRSKGDGEYNFVYRM